MRALFLAPDTLFELTQSINQSINQSRYISSVEMPRVHYTTRQTLLWQNTYCMKHDCVTNEQVPTLFQDDNYAHLGYYAANSV